MALIAHKGAVDLLLRILETMSGKISGAMIRANFAEAGDALLNASLLVKVGQTDVVPSMDEYEDEPTQVTWSSERESHGYLGANGQWVPVSSEELIVYAVRMESFFAQALVKCERASPSPQAPLIAGVLWDLGAFRLEGRGRPISVWFARRLHDQRHWEAIKDMMARRPAPDSRLIVTSSAGDLIPASQHAGSEIVSIRDIRADGNEISISPTIASKRLRAGGLPPATPIRHSADYGHVYLGSKTYVFTGVRQREILRILFEAYERGNPACLTTAVLEEAGSGLKVKNLSRAFSGRTDWQDFIRQKDGHCWIEV